MPGRPRSAECDRAILDAALAEYAAHGVDGMSVDAVAARAGVSKATIYRRYPSKVELVVAAAFEVAAERAPQPDTGSLRGDLRAVLYNLRALLDDSVLGAAVRMLPFDAVRHDDLARMHREFVRERRRLTYAVFDRAVGRGEMRAGVPFDFAADALVAPLFYRHLVLRERVDDAYVEAVVGDFVARFGAGAEPRVRAETT